MNGLKAAFELDRRARRSELTGIPFLVALAALILLASAILDNLDALDKHIQRSSAPATVSTLYDYPTFGNEHDYADPYFYRPCIGSAWTWVSWYKQNLDHGY